jgi:transposase-like protein
MSITKLKVTQKRKKHAPEYKARVVMEIISGKRTVAEIARADQIKDSMLYEWRNEALEKLPLLFTMEAPVQSQGERERELEQLIGQMAIENQALKKASQWLSFDFAQEVSRGEASGRESVIRSVWGEPDVCFDGVESQQLVSCWANAVRRCRA